MKIAAASCIRIQSQPAQPVWAEIQAWRPDLLLLLGDTVYLEHNDHDDPAALAAELRALYGRQLAEPHFAALLADLARRGGRVLALYDDHDFLGDNRCGGDAPAALREAARAEFVRALAPPRTGDEVWACQRADDVDLLLLDTRFHRRSPRAGVDDRDAVLGAAQWQWLEQQVAGSTAPYLLVASSITVHDFGCECWEVYPAAFQRLRRLLAPRRGALVLSGDIHRNAAYDDSGVVEIVTSGLARPSLLFDRPRTNYALLDCGAEALQVQLRSLKVGSRFEFAIPLARWALP